MITRIHGATSTLAANPGRKHHKRRNPAHARRRRVSAKRSNPKLTPEERAAKLATRKASALERLKRAQRALSKLSQPPKARKKKKRVMSQATIDARRAKAAARAQKKSARSAKAAFRAEYGYTLKPLPADATSLGYVYRGKKGAMIVSDKLLRGRKSKPRYSLYKSASGKFGLHKNPIGGLVVAGVPVVEMAIGSAATIAIGAISEKLIAKFAPAVSTSPVGDIAGELATAGVSALLYMKVLKNPMHKTIAQYAFVGAVFQILSKKASQPIKDLVGKIPGLGGYEYGSTHGVYFDPYTATQAVGGYLPVGGTYQSVDGSLGLFQSPSIYG